MHDLSGLERSGLLWHGGKPKWGGTSMLCFTIWNIQRNSSTMNDTLGERILDVDRQGLWTWIMPRMVTFHFSRSFYSEEINWDGFCKFSLFTSRFVCILVISGKKNGVDMIPALKKEHGALQFADDDVSIESAADSKSIA